MNITMRQINIFQSVARNLSYTKAAAEMHLTQPAVSMQVKLLEENLGLPLFEQIGKRIYLTDAGKEMLHYSFSISRQLEEIREVFASLQGIERGVLRLAVPGTANQFVTQFLAEFRRQHPAISFQLDIANRKGLLRLLENNEIDLVIMGKPPESMELVSKRFMDNPLVVIAAHTHALAKRKKISLSELINHEFVVREPGSGTRIAMQRFFEEHKVGLKTNMEMSSNETLKQAVVAGLGLGIVSAHTLEMELALNRVKVLDVEHFPIMRHWYLVHREGKRLAPVGRAFHDFILSDATKLWPLARKFIPDN